MLKNAVSISHTKLFEYICPEFLFELLTKIKHHNG